MAFCSSTRFLLVFALTFSGLVTDGLVAHAQDLKQARTPFDPELISRFVSWDLASSTPQTSIKAEGGPTTTVRGTLVDHNGEPIGGAFVAYATRIGYGGRNYIENFDVTDARGRFIVEAIDERERLVFCRGEGLVWPVNLEDPDQPVTVRWPEPASLKIEIDPVMCPADCELSLATTHYWAGMSANNVRGQATGHSAEFANLVPATYNLFAFLNNDRRKQFLIGQVVVAEGAEQFLEFDFSGRRRVLIDCDMPEGTFAHVNKLQTNYTQVTQTVSTPELNDGTWVSPPLPPGTYEIHFDIPVQEPENENQIPIWPMRETFRFSVSAGNGDVEVSTDRQAGDSPMDKISEVLDARPTDMPWSQLDVQASYLQTMAAEPEMRQTLCELINSPDTPFSWMHTLLQALGKNTEHPEVVDALLKKLDEADPAMQVYTLMALHKIPAEATERTLPEIERLCDSPISYVRRNAILAMANIAVNNEECFEAIVPFLIDGLSDPSTQTRWIAATNLGSFKAELALPELQRVQNEDRSGQVRVYAARAIWQISGDADIAIRTMTERLFADDMSGKALAARFLAELNEDLPELTIKGLQQAAECVPQPPIDPDSHRVAEVREAARQALVTIAAQQSSEDGN